MKTIALGFLMSLTAISAASEGESVPIRLSDDVTLSGTYYGATSPGPGLLFLNMCDPERDQTEWVNVAGELASAGYHVMTFDYRGFGNSGGTMPTNLDTIEKAMPYWREHWMDDVQAAYELLLSQPGVDESRIGVAGASCGVFMGLEFTLANTNVKTLVGLGGPTQSSQRDSLRQRSDLPMLIIAGNEGPIREWSQELFPSATHPDSRMLMYNAITYGTKLFGYDPKVEVMVTDWFREFLPLE